MACTASSVEGMFAPSATQVQPGNPAVFQIAPAKQEIGYGDRLVPAARPELVDYVPHAPDQRIEGRVVSVYGGVGSGGKLSIFWANPLVATMMAMALLLLSVPLIGWAMGRIRSVARA